jgi:hypothetical protein
MELNADGISVFIFRPEYLAAIALETGRQKDKYRLNTILASGIFDERVLKTTLGCHWLGSKYREWIK